jgi:hypothetical protein|tara:strand:- start:363 stop:467 length:105 start_codon:yes stop_codon:yes gene_type:complete
MQTLAVLVKSGTIGLEAAVEAEQALPGKTALTPP